MKRIGVMRNDIIKLITAFDNYLDDMFDRGQFDPTNEEDAKLDRMLKTMKQKYL